MDDGGAAALIAEIQVHGETRYSDSNWKISNVYQQGWEDADFDDSSWTNATEYGIYGVSPWRKRVSGLDNASQANWIWSDNNVDDDIVYFRHSVLVDDNGQVDPVNIDTLTLADGDVNADYNAILIGSGGSGSYLWSVTSGTLPEGLMLNNETGGISGTPTTQGINNFTVTLEDSDGDSTGSDLSITIVAQQDEDVVLNLIISGDNGEEVYINGSYVGGSNNWFTASNYSAVLNEGNNIIAVKGIDDGGAAALIAEIQVHGETRYSDSNWKISNVYQQGWEDADFDDSSWTNATEYGSYGVSPWRKRVSGLDNASQANWIWSDNNDDDNVIYFRYTISNN
jgi:hypothetical protein